MVGVGLTESDLSDRWDKSHELTISERSYRAPILFGFHGIEILVLLFLFSDSISYARIVGMGVGHLRSYRKCTE